MGYLESFCRRICPYFKNSGICDLSKLVRARFFFFFFLQKIIFSHWNCNEFWNNRKNRKFKKNCFIIRVQNIIKSWKIDCFWWYLYGTKFKYFLKDLSIECLSKSTFVDILWFGWNFRFFTKFSVVWGSFVGF